MGNRLNKEEYWEAIVKSVQQIMANTMPKILFEPTAIAVGQGGEMKITFAEAEIVAKSVVHLNVINYVRTVIIKESSKNMPLKASLSKLTYRLPYNCLSHFTNLRSLLTTLISTSI